MLVRSMRDVGICQKKIIGIHRGSRFHALRDRPQFPGPSIGQYPCSQHSRASALGDLCCSVRAVIVYDEHMNLTLEFLRAQRIERFSNHLLFIARGNDDGNPSGTRRRRRTPEQRPDTPKHPAKQQKIHPDCERDCRC